MNYDTEITARIENIRMWEEIQKRRDRENLLKWILLVISVTMLVVMVLVVNTHASELPSTGAVDGLPVAPSSLTRPVETYGPDERMIVHNSPSRSIYRDQPRLIDWSFLLGHVVYGAATAFDYYQTAKNVGTCAAEGNTDLGYNPSNKQLAIHGAIEFGAVAGGDLLLKLAMRHNQVPGWMTRPMGLLGAAIGTAKHTSGGMQWVRLCQ